jgi:hypothetical protein
MAGRDPQLERGIAILNKELLLLLSCSTAMTRGRASATSAKSLPQRTAAETYQLAREENGWRVDPGWRSRIILFRQGRSSSIPALRMQLFIAL